MLDRFHTHRAWRLLRRVSFLRSGLYFGLELRKTWHAAEEVKVAAVDEPFHESRDPWKYETDAREQSRFLKQTEMLDQARKSCAFRAGLEIGCAEGLFTEVLAERCATLVVLDLSPTALSRARQRRAWPKGVCFLPFDLGKDAIAGTFDLIVVAGVLEYFLRRSALVLIREKLAAALRPNGFLLLESTRQSSVVEDAWWGRYFIRGRQLNAFVARHPSLTTISSHLSDSFSILLCQKAAPEAKP